MASQPDPASDTAAAVPETLGAPSEYADAAEAPQWVQAGAKLAACAPLALSAAAMALLVVLGLALCLLVAVVLIF